MGITTGQPQPTVFQLHQAHWGNGCGHKQCSNPRTKICLVRGVLPCDVLFVGEAPGESENVIGLPFVGQAGRLLDDIVARGITRDYPSIRIAFGNLVGCIPREAGGANKAGEPDCDQIRKCEPRLVDLIQIAQPKLIVTVGRLSRHWLTPGMKDSVDVDRDIPRVDIIHPAAILRLPENICNLKVQESIVTINNAVEELMT